jgi:uncharacterized protein (TIGR02594 family)
MGGRPLTSLSETIYRVAAKDIGTVEWAEGSNPIVLDYYKRSGHPEIRSDDVPWCAAFVGAVLAKCGLPNTGSLLARSYEQYGEAVPMREAARGDIIVLSRGEPWQGHVGFFHSLQGGVVNVLGGNQNDQVSVKPYSASTIVAIRRAKAPRASISESTSLQTSQLVKVVQIASPVVGIVAGVPWQTVAAIGVVSLVSIIALFYMDKERVSAWFGKGQR